MKREPLNLVDLGQQLWNALIELDTRIIKLDTQRSEQVDWVGRRKVRMRRLYVMNGWRLAPHCWHAFLFRPVRYESTPGWWSLSVFGVTVSWTKR